ncbi:MAG: hypothetical protein WDA75_09040, partial [Candidatus Latescibacterota bacterium]
RGQLGLIACPECPPCHLRHLTARARTRGLRVWTTETVAAVTDGWPEVRFGVSGEGIVTAGETRAVVVAGGSIEVRAYWLGRCLSAGIRVLAEQPLAIDLGPARTVSGLLTPMARSVFTSAGTLLTTPQGSENRVVALELSISVPREVTQSDHLGLLSLPGLDYLGMLEPAFGPLDAVWARTRSLLRSGPSEDWAIAALRFRDGTEGTFRVNGLGQGNLVSLELHGRTRTLSAAHALPVEDGPELARLYDWFIDALADPQAKELPGYDLASAVRLHRWMNQSARMNREVQRHEVVHGS